MSTVTQSRPLTDRFTPLRPVVPVVASAGAATLLLGAVTLAERGGEVPLFITHLVVLLVAAGPAYLLDDRSADVTAVVPRPLLRRRSVIVGKGMLVAAAGWGVVVLLLRWRSPSAPLDALTWETAALTWVGLAAAAVVSGHGVSEPGNQVASGLGLLVVGVLVGQRLLPFPVLVTTGDGPARIGWWVTATCSAVAIFVFASRQRGRRSDRGGGGRRGGGAAASRTYRL